MKALTLSLAFVLAACVTGCSDDDDTVVTTTDTGTAQTDTGSGQIDTGTTQTDTGTTQTDTGSPQTDTGSRLDTAVGDTGGSETSAATKHTVDVGPGGNNFAPASLTIKVGDTVEWTWKSDAHTVTEASGTGCTPRTGGFDSGLRNNGATFTRTFNAAGTVNYFCTPHCALGMKGTITVTP